MTLLLNIIDSSYELAYYTNYYIFNTPNYYPHIGCED
jgi:hypothetical protein